MLRHNPIIARELVLNLRRPRAFVLLGVALLFAVSLVYAVYPVQQEIDVLGQGIDGRYVADVFFISQFAAISLLIPGAAATAIAGEKERKTYEMLLASPLPPTAIVLGKFLASMTHLLLILIASAPIVFVCLPLGGIATEEVIAAYVAIVSTSVALGMLAIYCSSLFRRSSSAMAVSYMCVLPVVIIAALLWLSFAQSGRARVTAAAVFVPLACLPLAAVFWALTSQRLLYPKDLSGAIDRDEEDDPTEVIGMYIDRTQFPDSLLAPPRSDTIMEDGVNPVFNKEIHAELFSQGTLMMRLVIQVSFLLAIFLMGYTLLLRPEYFPYYLDYVLLFNALVAGVFSAGAICSERERQTLDLLLTSTLTPAQIVWGKFLATARVSVVLTGFLMFPIALGIALSPGLRASLGSLSIGCGIILATAVVNPLVALAVSSVQRRTVRAMIMTFGLFAAVYLIPLVVMLIGVIIPDNVTLLGGYHQLHPIAASLSPFVAVHTLPVEVAGESKTLFEGPIAFTALFAIWIVAAAIGAVAVLATQLGYREERLRAA